MSKEKGSSLGWFTLLVGAVGAGYLIGRSSKPRAAHTTFEGKITPNDPIVRKFAIDAVHRKGEYNILQSFDIFNKIQSEIEYISDPEPDYIALPRDTIVHGAGDCDCLAALATSAVKSIGGKARIIELYDQDFGHAFTEIYVGPKGTMQSWVVNVIQSRYNTNGIHWEIDENSDEWLIFDTLLAYPGAFPLMAEQYDNNWNWPSALTIKFIV